MEKLSHGLNETRRTGDILRNGPLARAGKEWASYCLDTYNGDLVRKGIEISLAISAFMDELYRLHPDLMDREPVE